jgi:micrococcal nuclease
VPCQGRSRYQGARPKIVCSAIALGQIPSMTDGDTVKIAGVAIRLTDYDSPELFSPKCPKEYARAAAAKHELERIIDRVTLKLVPCATANYGRLCARGTIDDKPLAEYMISRGLGTAYICTPTRGHCPPKVDWCHID